MTKKIFKLINICFFWLTWPAVFVALNNTQRTRLLYLSQDKVLLTKGWLNDGRWGLPGGGLGRKEQPIEGLIREVKEETGLQLDPKSISELGSGEVSERGIHYQAHYFSAETPTEIPIKAHKEIMKAVWLKTDELNPKNSAVEVIEALRLYRQG